MDASPTGISYTYMFVLYTQTGASMQHESDSRIEKQFWNKLSLNPVSIRILEVL